MWVEKEKDHEKNLQNRCRLCKLCKQNGRKAAENTAGVKDANCKLYGFKDDCRI